jgi:2-polyprenyl-3-methyl-5-hydroxy-6-metoxy-1,4-benzoquinol methylase
MISVEAPPKVEYLMGHSDHEMSRLQLQADLLAPITRRLLCSAGLRAGMRLLDIGCGTGAVSVMAAEMVGDTGEVVGIDRSDTAVRQARAQHGARPNLRFHTATVEDLSADQPFDVVFGRYVLMHQPEPAALVRKAASLLRPGGVLAFHEIVLLDGMPCHPGSALWDQTNRYFIEAFTKCLRHVDLASQMVQCFRAAGVGVPELFAECLVGDAATSPITQWCAETVRTLAPELVASFGVTEAGLAIDTLADRLRAEADGNAAQVCSPRQICAWVRV